MTRVRMATVDIEHLAKAARKECTYLAELCSPPPGDGVPRMNECLGDPGTGPDFTRRSQAKHDLKFYRRQRDRLLDRLGALIAEGKVTV
jgi:hypothetical protein